MNKKLHILFLCGWYPSRVLENNGDFIERHAKAISQLHSTSVVHIISDKNCTESNEINTRHKNNISEYIGYIKPTKNKIVKIIRFVSVFFKIIRQLDKIDVIHLNELFPFGVFALVLRKPFIISEHWSGYKEPQCKKIGFWNLLISKIIIKKAKYTCPVSNDLKNSMEKLGFKGNYKVIPNVVDTNLFYPISREKNHQLEIVHISNMSDIYKNVSGILNAIAQLPIDYKFTLIGENSDKYLQLCKELKITEKVNIIDQIPHSEIVNYLQKADIYVSFSNYETWGIVMMEALACGCPVISTKTGILNELQKTEFTEIINIRDQEALKKAILKIQQRTFESSKMHHFVAENFSPSIIARQFSELYFKAIC